MKPKHSKLSFLLPFLTQPTHLFTAFRQSLHSPVTNNLDLFSIFHAEKKKPNMDLDESGKIPPTTEF